MAYDMATETKFTPGPWIKKTHHRVGRDWDGNPKKIPCWYISAENDVGIAVQPSYSYPRDEEANANLIAAAPDLYEALAAAVATIERDRLLWSGFPQQHKDDWELMLSEMKAALKKARGEQP